MPTRVLGSESMPPLPRLRGALCALLALVVLLCAPPALARQADRAAPRATAAGGCSGTHTEGAGRRQERAIACLINRVRARYGLRRMHRNRTLAVTAARYARAMSRRNFFGHRGAGGSTPVSRARRAGYRCRILGETLAYGRGYPGTPAGIVAQLMASPPHRRILLEPRVRDLGVGAARGVPRRGVHGGITVAAEFGHR
jgi:uncharacterized protein YkwD